MTSRVVGVVLLVVGVVATLVGLGGRLLFDDDEGHHDGRTPSFALSSVEGADELVVDVDGAELTVRVERAGQTITDYDEIHDARGHVFLVDEHLDSYEHVDLAEGGPDGTVSVVARRDGAHRVVFQGAPAAGPDLLELGVTVDVSGADVSGAPAVASTEVAVDDRWEVDGLTIERQGLDFVLSEPWSGEEHHGGPAFLAMFRADDLAFVHGHAETPDDQRFRFNLDLPGRGEYLAALEFLQDGQLVTALFRFTI